MISDYNIKCFIHDLKRAADSYRFVLSSITDHTCDLIILFATDSFNVRYTVETCIRLEDLLRQYDYRAYAHDIAAQMRKRLDDIIEKERVNMVNDIDRNVYCRLVSGLTVAPPGIKYNSMFKTSAGMPKIKDVIFNSPATIVFWTDGTKTVVKAQNEDFDPEKGLAMAFFKKMHGNKGHYFEEIKKWTEKYEPPKLSESALREAVRKAADSYRGTGAARGLNDILDDLFGAKNADDDE